MSTWDEKAAKAAVESRHAIYDGDFWGYSDQSDAQDDGFENGARWQREALLSEETVMRAARACFDIRDDAYDDREWGELDSQERELYLCQARAALTAALGEDEK